jgi:hypothetical protein
MTYTVIWIPSALDELAQLWNSASDRQEVTDTADVVDSILRHDPFSHSESREENLRIMFVPPLAVLFDVSDADCMVAVRAVWSPT